MDAAPTGSDFPSSQWSLIARAGADDRDEARRALADLCRRYWYPVYAFVRRQTRTPHDAEDLTQGFFTHLLERDVVADADPARGRFRTFLVACCRNYLANSSRARAAHRAGGSVLTFALDFGSASTRYAREPADPADPEALFRRRWALTVLEDALSAVDASYRASGQAEVFARLRPSLVSDGERAPYADLGRALGLTESAARKAAQRLRNRFRDELRRRVAETVASPGDVDDELRDLLAAVG